MSVATWVASQVARRAARDIAAEHLGTRRQREIAGRRSRELLADSPINTSGPVESAVLDLL